MPRSRASSPGIHGVVTARRGRPRSIRSVHGLRSVLAENTYDIDPITAHSGGCVARKVEYRRVSPPALYARRKHDTRRFSHNYISTGESRYGVKIVQSV